MNVFSVFLNMLEKWLNIPRTRLETSETSLHRGEEYATCKL